MSFCNAGERSRKNQRTIRDIRKLHVVSGELDFRLNKTTFAIYRTRTVNH